MEILPPSDTPAEDALSLKKPDFSKKFANIHYQSEATGEYGTIRIRFHTTIEDVFSQYCQFFPKEAKLFLDEIKMRNQSLLNSKGLSLNRSMMTAGSIPEIIMTACKFLYGEDYWEDKKNTLDFLRSNPKLMIGDHSRKNLGNSIIH